MQYFVSFSTPLHFAIFGVFDRRCRVGMLQSICGKTFNFFIEKAI